MWKGHAQFTQEEEEEEDAGDEAGSTEEDAAAASVRPRPANSFLTSLAQ